MPANLNTGRPSCIQTLLDPASRCRPSYSSTDFLQPLRASRLRAVDLADQLAAISARALKQPARPLMPTALTPESPA